MDENIVLAARTLDDFELSDDATRPDFELGERYLGLCKELTRLSLLGIAGYGFLIKEVVMKDGAKLPFFQAMVAHYLIMMAGLLALGLAAAASLYTSQVSTNCLKLQVDIVRYVKRRTNTGWTAEDKIINDRELLRKRTDQKQVIFRGKLGLKVAVGSLIIGTVMTVINFAVVMTFAK